MTQEIVSTTRSAIKYGLYVGIASVILYLLVYIMGLHYHEVSNMGSDVILIVGMIFAMREYKNLNNYMSYWQGIGIGTMVSVITGVMVGFFLMIYLSFNPQIMEQDLKTALEANERVGEMMGFTDEKMDELDEASRAMIAPPFYFISYLFSYLFFGFMLTLIVAAFQRKRKDVFDE